MLLRADISNGAAMLVLAIVHWGPGWKVNNMVLRLECLLLFHAPAHHKCWAWACACVLWGDQLEKWMPAQTFIQTLHSAPCKALVPPSTQLVLCHKHAGG